MQADYAHTASDRLKELAETTGAVLLLLGILARIGRVHLDRFIGGWFRRNKDVARAQVSGLMSEDIKLIRQLPRAINRLANATRLHARAQREHTRSMSSFSERIGKVEREVARIDERTSTSRSNPKET